MAVANNKAEQPDRCAPPVRQGGRQQGDRRTRRPRRSPISARTQELAAYRDMLLIRRFEEKAGQMYGMGLIGGFCHLYIGQEAVVVGMQMALKEGDAGHHRLPRPRPHAGLRHGRQGRDGGTDRPHAAATPRARAARCTCSPPRRASTAATASSPRRCRSAPGLAFANKYRGNDNVSLTYFGDGAANQGQVYESFNMAKLWKLPAIYIIENNQYAMGTSLTRASATTDLSQRGAAFDIPGEQVDGMDVRAVKAAADKATKWCREGKGPYHPRNADLPLSRPLDVRPGQVPHPRGGREGAHRARSDRAGAPAR